VAALAENTNNIRAILERDAGQRPQGGRLTNAKAVVLSIHHRGRKWVEISIPAD
jgi:hypothetical protein